MARYDVAIVGAGHAGAQLAISLRQAGFGGTIALIGAERHPPYERPALSKDYLAGEKDFERLLIRPESFWREGDIAWLGGCRVETVDCVRQALVTSGGETIDYQTLVWAAGGQARRLPHAGRDAANAHVVRGRDDVDAIIEALPRIGHATIVGGGYVGLEAAATLVSRGKSVTLIETAPRVLGRVAGEALSGFYAAQHRQHGVDLRLGAAVQDLIVEGGRITAVQLAAGKPIATDLLIMGIGIEPATAPLADAGAKVGHGVIVDEFCRTSLPGVYAIGDCASHFSRHAGGREVRIESVQNATDQAKTVAAHIMATARPYDAMPWFWSNQYDLKLQTVGLCGGYDQEIVRGDPASRSFSVLYLQDERLIAVDSVNCVKDYVQAKSLILSRARVDLARVGDASVPLKTAIHRADAQTAAEPA
jgi:3-phenylpropionate/trans-cinnamate dioxygenase ferredoxin reductase subunit